MPLITFEAEVLAKAKGDFASSKTVLEHVGVDNVCERASVIAAGPGAKLVVRKTAKDGITVAVAKRAK
jgi:cobalt-precorrin 5A hydrolase